MNQYNLISRAGNQYWYLDTEDRSAAVIYRSIYIASLYRHRPDGPAVIWPDGHQEWWVDGKLHRLDGPAVIYADGRQTWWVNNNRYRDNKSFQKAAGITDEEMTFVILKYGNVS